MSYEWQKPSTPTPHGTSGGYTNHRCRCDLCKKAWREAHKAYLDKHPEQREKARVRQREYHKQMRDLGFRVVNNRWVAPE